MDLRPDSDSARLGLVKEIMQVVLGLSPETSDRVMRTIRGSSDAADIKTPNMRKRIGGRAMRYLRNAVDIARNEGDEYHNDDNDIDMSKNMDIEPGHRHDKGMNMKNESMSLISYLNELNMDVDLSDPNSAVMKIKKAARMGADKAAIMNVKQSQEDMKDARSAEPGDPTRQIDMKIATLTAQLAQLQKRKAQMVDNNGGM